MPRGGSKPGERRGGRKKGTPNKNLVAREAEIASSGLTPLDYMLSVLRDPKQDWQRRDEMAKAAAPYCHPRLAQVQAQHSLSATLEALVVGSMENKP